MMKIIDAHLHLFNIEQGQYHWLKENNAPFWPDKKIIAKNFNEADLVLADENQLAGFVHIEAGFDNKKSWREIAWLESTCQLPFRAVAAIDLTLPIDLFTEKLIQLKQYASVVGCRHILDEQAEQLLCDAVVQQNLKLLAQHQLSFDLQMSLSDTKAVTALSGILSNNDDLIVIINHAGWPKTPQQTQKNKTVKQSWLAAIKMLSQYQHCAIKCSGWEMADRNYAASWLQEIVDTCIQYFGESRVMLASNFPLTLFSQNYQQLWRCYIKKIGLSELQLTALCHDNAKRWYRLT